ncbi:hypothetical protein BB559_006041 [Furculomyces boomerangus]|uniref:Uncharacterized protein n=2 Tax=Harpellales TaxID=61421 RepID=A0A2T9Y540_9FUNG|nr:hypothetical protein BB559_006041 [Furculomyces boomerangus]PWA02241.1 hypothetical protein BB558_001633 [Smittium angustum]
MFDEELDEFPIFDHKQNKSQNKNYYNHISQVQIFSDPNLISGIDIPIRKQTRKVSFSTEATQVLYIPSNNTLKQVEKAREKVSSSFPQNPSIPEEVLDPACSLTSIFMHRGNLHSFSTSPGESFMDSLTFKNTHKTPPSKGDNPFRRNYSPQ